MRAYLLSTATRTVTAADRAYATAQRTAVLAAGRVNLSAVLPGTISGMRQEVPAGLRTTAKYGTKGVLSIRGAVASEEDEVLTWMFGGVPSRWISEDAKILAVDPSIEEVWLDMSSPGGSVEGYSDIAESLNALAKAKPLYAVVHDQAYSLAAIIAAHADKVYITETGGMGNVGVIMGPFFDETKAMNDAGIEAFYAAAPDGKADGRPGASLSDEFKESMNAAVAKWFDVVARPFEKRGIDRAKLAGMNARIYAGSDAVAAGLADEVVASFESVVSRPVTKRVSHGHATLAHAARSKLEKRPMSITKEQWDALTPELVCEHRPDLLPDPAKVTEPEQAASIETLEASFTGEPAFVLGCVKAKLTLTGAKAAFGDVLAVRLKEAEARVAELSKVDPAKAKAAAVVAAQATLAPGSLPKGDAIETPKSAADAVELIKTTKGLRGPAASAEARKTWPALFR